MASYANDNSENYIPEKDVKRGDFDENTKAREPWSSQKTRRLPTRASETEKEVTRQSPWHYGTTIETVGYDWRSKFR